MGLRLGRAFQGMGAEARREALRALPMAVADLVGEAFETDARARRARRARRAVRGDSARGRREPRRCSCSTRPATTAARPGRRRSRAAGPARSPTRWSPAVRAFGGEIRTGAEVDAVRATATAPRGVALAERRGDRGAVVVSRHRPEADAARGSSTRWCSGRSWPGGRATSGCPASCRRSTWRCRACRVRGRGGDAPSAVGPDRDRAGHRLRSSGRSTHRSTAA